MSLRDLTIVDDDSRKAMIARNGGGWAVLCIVLDEGDEGRCPPIVGYSGRAAGIRGAEAHLLWHSWGKPTCSRCGEWLGTKGAKRCRKNTPGGCWAEFR